MLDGRFRIESEAGAGGMGVVMRAHDLHTGQPVAIKIVRSDQRANARFQRESRVLAQLHHPGIVGYVAHGTTASGALYLAMEWLEGEDLAARLARGPLGIAESLDLARRVADALAAAHARGIVHRDLKPSNLFLPHGEIAEVKLLDFGVARLQNTLSAMTAAGALVGTPGYMAPEQARGDALIDSRADVFSLGCVLFECLTGRPAFVGETVLALLVKIMMEEAPRASELRNGLPAAIDELVARMLAKTPANRPADGAAARDAITKIGEVGGAFDDGPVAPAAITRGEQHLVSVVIVGGRSSAGGPVTAAMNDDEAANPMSAELAQTMIADDASVAFAELARFGARVEALADGAIVATLDSTGAATDQAAQAARCALALRHISPSAPIALATGRAAFAGRLPIGPVIEKAAKLLRAIGGSEENGTAPIHLDDVTAGLLPTRFRVREGLAGTELVAEDDADVARTVLGKPTRFVGREPEMGTLIGVYGQIETDAIARAAIVTGAPGLGKSRLREELVITLRARESSPAIWIGSAEPLGAGRPFGILARILRDAIGVEVGASARSERDRIVDAVKGRLPQQDAARVSTFLAELVGAPLDRSPALPHAEAPLQAARREPPLMAEQMQRAFVDYLRSECAVRPVVLVLEDAHWADLPTMKLLDAALRELAESPFLVIAFARPEIDDAFPALWTDRSVIRLSLGLLTSRAAERLARDVLGAEVDAAVIRKLVAHAAGNPFFLEELLRASVHESPGTLPGTLIAIVQKRLEALDESSRRILRAASVYGAVFWRGATCALLGDGAQFDVDRRLTDLVEREVVVRHVDSRMAGEAEYAFRHALVRDAAYQMLTDADRVLGHRFAGAWLETAGETNDALLAEHFEQGEDGDRAARHYARAAAQALRADDLEGCIRFAKRGLALVGEDGDVRGALHLARAEAHHWRADFEDAFAEGTEALHLLTRGSDAWFAAIAITVGACATLGRANDASALARDLARTHPERRSARMIAAAQCVAFFPPGDPGDELLALLPDATLDMEDSLLAARVHVARASRAQAKGEPVLLLDHLSQAAAHFDRAGHARGARAARANAGYASAELGRHEEAERTLRAAIVEARSAGALGTVAWASMHLGMVLGRTGRVSEALSVEDEARRLAHKQGNRLLEAEVGVATADLLNASGASDLAVKHAEAAANASDAPALRAAALSALATARVALGDAESARAAAREAIEILEKDRGAQDVEPIVRLAFASSLRALGQEDESLEAISAARDAVLARASHIADLEQRETFLREVPANARILQLATEWSTKRV